MDKSIIKPVHLALMVPMALIFKALYITSLNFSESLSCIAGFGYLAYDMYLNKSQEATDVKIENRIKELEIKVVKVESSVGLSNLRR
jgi:glycine cleavage system aminomethyltransferase T